MILLFERTSGMCCFCLFVSFLTFSPDFSKAIHNKMLIDCVCVFFFLENLEHSASTPVWKSFLSDVDVEVYA